MNVCVCVYSLPLQLLNLFHTVVNRFEVFREPHRQTTVAYTMNTVYNNIHYYNYLIHNNII